MDERQHTAALVVSLQWGDKGRCSKNQANAHAAGGGNHERTKAIQGTGLFAVRPVCWTIRTPGGPTLPPLEVIKAGIVAMAWGADASG